MMTSDVAVRELKFKALALVVPVTLVATIGMPLLVSGDLETVQRMVVAVAPSLMILCWFVSSDRFPEPPSIVLGSFLLGALSIFPAAIGSLLAGPSSSPVWNAFAMAAIPEESAKLFVLLLYCARHRAFDEPMDGLVYGVTVSLGFATVENIAYVFNPPPDADWVTVAVIRGLFAVPMHAILGATLGFFVGLSQALPDRRRRLLWIGWAAAVLIHGAYDSLSFSGLNPLPVVILSSIVVGRLRRKLENVQRGENPETILQQVYQMS